ncbi:MAG: LysM peptidoglycan-binding domain-containing protein [Flavobacterium sp.]
MNRFYTFLFCSLFFAIHLFSQEKVITHKVAKGETITQIAQKYKVSPFDIYQLNPDAQSGISQNTLLLIPTEASKKSIKKVAAPTAVPFKNNSHLVVAKETLFGILKKYHLTEAVLFKANPFLEKDGLQIGQTLVIPDGVKGKTLVAMPPKAESPIFHLVQPQETKFSIAKKYQITIEELEQKNPEVVANLPIGFNLIIKGKRPKEAKLSESVIRKKEVSTTNEKPSSALVENQSYVVKPKETLYSLTKMTGMSPVELIAMNPDLKNGVQEGMILKLPLTARLVSVPELQKGIVQLSKQTSGAAKKLVLLLPFNTAKIANDTVNSTIERLKKDKFLNMTLDFYAGALVAIDSAKQLGIQVDVQVYDSQETKNSSAVPSLLNSQGIDKAQVVIGPFYQHNVEKTAELLGDSIAVISPLSKDYGRPFSNLYQSIVAADLVKNAVFDFMKSKNGNMIAVIDKKKESSKNYFIQYQKEVKLAPLTPSGGVNVEALKNAMSADRINYVILETGSTTMIKATMAAMLSVMKVYKVQLVILEPNPTLDTDEISFANLVKLQLLYPSTSRENTSEEATVFARKYRKLNNVYPSAFAIRGFDITFDTLMRMAQEATFQETIANAATEQVENRFDYYLKEDGGYCNKGVYILYYDSDMTIKQAN